MIWSERSVIACLDWRRQRGTNMDETHRSLCRRSATAPTKPIVTSLPQEHSTPANPTLWLHRATTVASQIPGRRSPPPGILPAFAERFTAKVPRAVRPTRELPQWLQRLSVAWYRVLTPLYSLTGSTFETPLPLHLLTPEAVEILPPLTAAKPSLTRSKNLSAMPPLLTQGSTLKTVCGRTSTAPANMAISTPSTLPNRPASKD